MAQCELAFGRFRLQPGRQLLVDGKPVALGAKPLNILGILAAAGGDLVTKDELIERVWPGMVVEENALQAHISAIRKVMGEDGRWIATVPGHGYRFEGPLHRAGDGAAPSEPRAPDKSSAPAIRAVPHVSRRFSGTLIAGALVLFVVAAGLASWRWSRPSTTQGILPERYLVLPFVNRTGDPHNDDFADALTDTVAARIAAQTWDSEVVGHNKAFNYKGQEINEMKLAEQLNLTYIVEGSLLPGDGGIEASATIVDAQTGTQMASFSARPPKGENKVEPQWIAAGLVNQAQWAITRARRRQVVAGKIDDGDIRNLLVRAKIAMDGQSLDKAWPAVVSLIDKALKLDPHNVHALCVAAAARIQYVGVFAYRDEAERTAKLNEAEPLLENAVRIEPTRIMSHLLLGDLRIAQGRHDAARAEYQRALDLDPLSADGLEGLAVADIFSGNPEAAQPKLDRARVINPEDVYLIDGDLAFMRLTLGQDADALVAIHEAATANSTDPWTWMALAGLLQLNNHPDEARAALTTLRRLSPGITIAKLRLADANTAPLYRQSMERLYAALKEAGLEEGSAR